MLKATQSGLAGAPPAREMLKADVDSPQKKLLNARAQKVTNFKLGLSGSINSLSFCRARCSNIREAVTVRRIQSLDIHKFQPSPTLAPQQHQRFPFWLGQPDLQAVPSPNLEQSELCEPP